MDLFAAVLVMAALASMQIGAMILAQYGDYMGARRTFSGTFLTISGRVIGAEGVPPEMALSIGAAFVTMSVAAGVSLVFMPGPAAWAGVVILVGLALSIAYAVRPVRLARFWIGDIVVALVVGTICPLAAFIAHAGWRTEGLGIVLPTTMQMLALLTMIDFTDVEFAALSGRRSFVVVLGRERAWWLATGFILAGAAVSLGTYALGMPMIVAAAMSMAFVEEAVFMQLFRGWGRTQRGYTWLSGLGAAFLAILQVSIILTLVAA